MNLKKIYGFISLVLVIVLAGCKGASEPSDKNELDMYTTVYPLQYIVEQIAGEYVNVETIYPPGADEHTYEPTQKEMINLAQADSLFYIGLGLEGFVDKAQATLKKENVSTYAVGERLAVEYNDDPDPHVWLDPILMVDMSTTIFEVLQEKLPEHKTELEENYNELVQELKNLDQSFVSLIEQAKHKEIIVSHAAYGYWEKRYGIEQISIAGKSSTSEPTQKELQSIIQYVKENDLKYVLYEQNTSTKLTDVVKNEANVDSLTLHNLSVRTDEDIKENKDYLSIMEGNMDTLRKALN